jgi:hypothetical protein
MIMLVSLFIIVYFTLSVYLKIGFGFYLLRLIVWEEKTKFE